MTKIQMKPNPDFGMSDLDRSHLSRSFEYSFYGDIVFRGVEEITENLSLVFIGTSLIESEIMINRFGITSIEIPVTGTDRSLVLESVPGMCMLDRLEVPGIGSLRIGIELDDVEVKSIFNQLRAAIDGWHSIYPDDRHRLRGNWVVDAMARLDEQDG